MRSIAGLRDVTEPDHSRSDDQHIHGRVMRADMNKATVERPRQSSRGPFRGA